MQESRFASLKKFKALSATLSAWLDNKRRGPNGVFWGRVGLFGINLHFYFGLFVDGKEKQHLNGKEPKKEEKGE